MLKITPSVFVEGNAECDFRQMLRNPKYYNSLFLISENFIDMLYETRNGKGTAMIRDQTWPNKKLEDRPRAIGVPTGWSTKTGGFQVLDNQVRRVIDLSFERVLSHLFALPHIDEIVYSANKEDDALIGTGIFRVADCVVQYISMSIRRLAKLRRPELQPIVRSLDDIRKEEYGHFQLAQVLHDRAKVMHDRAKLIEERAKLVEGLKRAFEELKQLREENAMLKRRRVRM